MTEQPSSAPDPSELAERIRAGDVAAFGTFVGIHWTPLVRYVLAILGSVDDAKDVVQEAFTRLWEQRAGVRADGSVRAYTYRIARNLALNERNRRELHRTLAAEAARERVPARTPARALEAMELRTAVERAIDALPERRREAFVLAHLQGLPHREIADVMGIAPQTVANQISAALSDLRRELGPRLIEFDRRDAAGKPRRRRSG